MNNGFYEFSRGKQETTSSVFPYTGSAIISGNLTVTGSISATQGFTGSLFGTASFATSASRAVTSSFAISASWAPSQTIDTSSLVTTSSFNAFTSSYNTGSFTGSFRGDGSGLTNLPVQNINTSSLATTGSNTFRGNQIISGSLNVTGSITGSLFGTASVSTNIIVTDDTDTDAVYYPILSPSSSGAVGARVDSVNLKYNPSTNTLTTGDLLLNTAGGPRTLTMQAVGAGGTEIKLLPNTTAGYARINVGNTNQPLDFQMNSVDVMRITQAGDIGIGTIQPNAKLDVNGNAIVTGSLTVTNGITGSLFGTASWATNAVTASYVNTLNQNVQISGSLKLDPTQDPDPSGLDQDSTVLFQSSSNTTLGYDLYFRQNGNLVKWKWIEGNLESGLLYGGVVTYSGSDVYVSPGSGIIVEHNATTSSEISPMVEYVTWNAITQSIANIATKQVTYIYIDQNGDLQQQSSRFTAQEYHNYIPLGAVGHFDYTQVSAFGGAVQTAYDQISQTSNFIDAFGPLKVSGYGLTGQTNSLRLSVGSGTSYIHGGFYQNDPEFPSQATTPSQATASFAYVYRSGSGVQFDTNGGNLYTSIRPGFYDSGTGTISPVSNNNWTIQRVHSDPKTGILYIYYGQNVYTTYLNAVGAVSTDSFTEGDTFDFTTFIGFLILKSNTTNITDTADNKIVSAGLFRGSGQGSGGGVVLSNLDDLTDVSITSPVNGQALIYNSGIWQNGNPTSASFATTSSFAQSGNGLFSGSFSGSGANLNSIPASAITGLNLSQIATGSVTASVSPTQFTVSSASIAEFVVTGTGVTLGSVITDIHNVTGSLNITGSITATTYNNLPTASVGSSGILSSTDWNTFNNKQTDLETFNRTQGVYFFDDFMGTLNANFTNTPNGIITTVGNGQGTLRSTSTITNRTNQQGVVEALTSANGTGTAGYYYSGGVYKGSGAISIETYINFTTLSVLGERFWSLFGFYTGQNYNNPPNFIVITYDEGGTFVFENPSPNFKCVSRSASGTRTTTITSVPVVAGQWYRLRINISNDGSTVTFFINNALVGTHSTNIPTNATFLPIGSLLQKSSGVAARAMQTDYFMYKEVFTNPR